MIIGRFCCRAEGWQALGKVSLGTRALLRVLGPTRDHLRAVPELSWE